MNVPVEMKNVDWNLLRRQKLVLLKKIEDEVVGGVCSSDGHVVIPRMETRESQALTGILHLLDYIQDEAALVLGEKAVFGVLERR